MGYEPNVDYFFGFPRSIKQGGVAFDIPLVNISAVNDGNAEKKKQFVIQTGVLSSVLEHAVPEQMFNTDPTNPPDAISAVKALAKANAAGQRIYTITQANSASILPNIHHDPATMDEIRASLAVGKEVITHTDAVSVPGWSGAGYIILDSVTGDGAYKIGGGANGGILTAIGIFFIFTALFWATATATTFGLLAIAGFSALIGGFGLWAFTDYDEFHTFRINFLLVIFPRLLLLIPGSGVLKTAHITLGTVVVIILALLE